MIAIKRILSIAMIYGFIGAVVVTVIAPSISRLLITAPVAFGVNCEPAANWAMNALIRSQMIGFIGGILTAAIWVVYSKTKEAKKSKSN